jgi:N-methylhydantoinase B
VLDYFGSSPEVDAAVNVTLPMTTSYSVYPIKVALDPGVPNNAGCLAPIRIAAEPGSVLDCRPPAPTWGRSIVSHSLPELVFGALAQAVPERTIAACGSTPLTLMTFAGVRASGDPFLAVASHIGGFGGSDVQDGAACLPFPNNTAAIPIEIVETETCLVYERKELALDSGGPGRRRGGLGENVALRVASGTPADRVTASIRGWNRAPNSAFPVSGLRGGKAGRGGALRINDALRRHNEVHMLVAGDRIELSTPGGGGFGDPLDREPDFVLRDVRDGLVSMHAARTDYGVVIAGNPPVVDAEATALARATLRRSR